MNTRVCCVFVGMAILILGNFSFPGAIQQSLDYGKILGVWKIEVNADGEYYYVTLNLKSADGILEGTVSESMGTFTDVPVSEIAYDGENLSFEFNSATPPDGVERLVSFEFRIGEDTMDGVVIIPELGVSATATATREKD
ncbi:MAG: hypothetical protein FJY81_01905 [Candidatus Aminicenantes bacterium]|nr:hypothetical protein [Candidatus Aminicenantes bacterium]